MMFLTRLFVAIVPFVSQVASYCVPSYINDVPAIQCSVYNPFVRAVVPGPVIPYAPYVENAMGYERWNYDTRQEYLDGLHNWQTNEFDRYTSFVNESPWPKSYGYDVFLQNQKDWLEYNQEKQRLFIDTLHEDRTDFLNWLRPTSPTSPTPSTING